MLLALLAGLGIALCFVAIPQLARRDVAKRIAGASDADKPSIKETIELEIAARDVWIKLVGGALLFIGAYTTWNQMVLAQQGQLAASYTDAINLLGTSEGPEGTEGLPQRMGGVFALAQVARSSQEQREATRYILAAYIEKHGETSTALAYASPEVNAAMNILFPTHSNAVQTSQGPTSSLELNNAHLGMLEMKPNAEMSYTRFSGADLRLSILKRSYLRDADLTNVDFTRAHLDGADLTDAILKGAIFHKAILTNATGLPKDFITTASVDSTTQLDGTVFANTKSAK